ncbi:hypothetical protein PVAND_007518 [Polypedilum vanderplanki]|uniref:BTB domain-containing protein n=1 Tax=Polypedilum vanderplanki TaxID=319348 RepID=A0A9J6C6J1_POLVA|nr:hypothetical protein PVAND_007518 [Polypedilum vanderplanki]
MNKERACFEDDIKEFVYDFHIHRRIIWNIENFPAFQENTSAIIKISSEMNFCDHYVSKFKFSIQHWQGNIIIKEKVIKKIKDKYRKLDEQCWCNDSESCCDLKCFKSQFYYYSINCFIKSNDQPLESLWKLYKNMNYQESNETENGYYIRDQDIKIIDGKLTLIFDIGFGNEVFLKINSISYAEFIDDENYNDFSIVCNDGITVYANRIVLAKSSPVFKAMFQTDMSERQKNEIILNDIDSKTMKEFINFVYGKHIENFDDLVDSLLYCAEKYLVSNLKDICTKCLHENLDKNNAFETLAKAETYNLEPLMDQCITFILKLYNDIENMNEFKNLSQSLQDQIIAEKKVFMVELTSYYTSN